MLQLSEPDDALPEFVRHVTYQRDYEVELQDDGITELDIVVDELDAWNRGATEWHKLGDEPAEVASETDGRE